MERPLRRPAWYPDWSDHPCAIIASGPSAKKANVEALRGAVYTIAIKESVQLCPWADVVYGCDAAWWQNERGLPNFKGLKVAYSASLRAQFPDIRLVEIAREPRDRLVREASGVVGAGGNSGFQALNLAAQLGARAILLIGFDMHGRNGLHWYGRNNGPSRTNPDEQNFRRWVSAMDAAAADLRAWGVEVVNASLGSDLSAFRKMTIEDTMSEWFA